ncbi:hypothetical protein DOT_6137 [Desulfosporosinus sp. OT]|nr:hypothetical protein DOT_6137 [Desulfosporosinus sp. OT]
MGLVWNENKTNPVKWQRVRNTSDQFWKLTIMRFIGFI